MSNVIDLDAARERLLNTVVGGKLNVILYALDTLAIALAERGHQWTDEEVRLYETAVEYLK